MLWLYLDPGSGSLLIQLLIASLAGLMIFFGTNWRKFKRMFRRNKDQNDESDHEDGYDDEDD